jgi:hypothetical protein
MVTPDEDRAAGCGYWDAYIPVAQSFIDSPLSATA